MISIFSFLNKSSSHFDFTEKNFKCYIKAHEKLKELETKPNLIGVETHYFSKETDTIKFNANLSIKCLFISTRIQHTKYLQLYQNRSLALERNNTKLIFQSTKCLKAAHCLITVSSTESSTSFLFIDLFQKIISGGERNLNSFQTASLQTERVTSSRV